MTADTDAPPSLLRKSLVAGAMAIVGGAAGFTVATLVGDHITRWEDDVALVMATSLVGIGVISAGVVAFRPSSVPKGCGVLQVIVLLLAGVMMLGPMFGTAVADPVTVFTGVMVLLVGQTVANVMLWFKADEMLRRVMMETCAMAFWVLQGALFIYAAAERLGLVATVSGWGLMGILMAVYLGASVVASARRGMS